jgi:hypothetical protein
MTPSVILSEAKDPFPAVRILRYAQNDMCGRTG